MRYLTAVLLTVVLLAGCADDPIQNGAERWTPTDEQTWTGRITVDDGTGEISAPGFNEFVDSARPAWAKSLAPAAAQLLDLNRPFDGPVKIYLLEEEDDGRPVATFTLTGLGDDSVNAARYRVVFDRGDGGLHRFVSGGKTIKCHSDRGHQDFTYDPCL